MEEYDKVEELVAGVRPVLRGFRYGGNIRLSKTPKLLNCEALEVYVDAQRFTLYPGSDMEVQAGAAAGEGGGAEGGTAAAGGGGGVGTVYCENLKNLERAN